MSAYITPIKTAMMIFPLIALAISGIFFIYQYRKYGHFQFFRGVILYSFVFYLLCAYLLVILPLPPIEAVAKMTGPRYELHFGASLQHFLQFTVLNLKDPSTYLPALKQNVFLEPVFNVIITIPFGIYLRYFFKFNWKKTVLASFCLTLFFELTQLTGLYFIYPRPYRLFDVNDLFNNTLGGLIGFWIEPLFTFLLPSRQEMDEEAYEEGREVTLYRRLAAFLVDWLIITLFSIVTIVVTRYMTGDFKLNFINTSSWYFLMIFLYFILLDYFLKGATPGKRLVRIKVMEVDREKVSFKALFFRYGILYLVYGGIGQLTPKMEPWINSANHFQKAIGVIVTIGIIVIQLLFFAHVIWSLLRKRRQLFYERMTHTYVISTITPK